MRYRWFIRFCLAGTCFGSLYAQDSVSFRSPVDFEIKLSGSFAELRPNHFHMGLDIKTFGEGKKVYAAESGYLTRIKVSPYGYGHALYVRHAGGYSTLYGHLREFIPSIEAFVKQQQYHYRSEEIDVEVPDSMFRFKKGDLIAYSGNTGSSEGPHLHFEIRDAITDEAYDPLQFHIPIKDTRAPIVYGLKVYPIGPKSSVKGSHDAVLLSFRKDKSGLPIGSSLSVKANGRIAIGVQANDYMNESGNRNGIYEIKVFAGDSLYFHQQLHKIDFAATRYINTYMDHDEYKKYKRHIHKCYRYGNNKLDVYRKTVNDGFIDVRESDTLKLRYEVKDGSGNTKTIHLTVYGEEAVAPAPKDDCRNMLRYNQNTTLAYNDFSAQLDAGTVYDSLCVDFLISKKIYGTFSDLYSILGGDYPIQEYYTVNIKIPDSLNVPHEKLLIGMRSGQGWKYCKTIAINGTASAQVREWGTFALVADTLAPVIQVNQYKDSMSFYGNKQIVFTLADNFGLNKKFVYVNGEWIRAHWYARKGRLYFRAKELNLPSGYYPIELYVSDVRDNEKRWNGIIRIP